MEAKKSAAIVARYCRILKLPITNKSLITEMERHPDAGSLFAISDVMNHWNIPNTAFTIDEENLKEVPLPFIACMEGEISDFILVEDIAEGHYLVSDDKKVRYKIPSESFKKSFTGSVLVAVFDPEAVDPNYLANRRSERMETLRLPIVLAGIILLLIISLGHNFYFSGFSWLLLSTSFVKLCGVIVSILLLIQSIDLNNPLVGRFCSGSDNNCNAILSSKAAKLTPELSWSEVGFFYFSGSLLSLLAYGLSTAALQTLGWLNVLCLPYTLYSLYYQFRIAKQFCVFCCTIQALLWIEFFTFLSVISQPYTVVSAWEFLGLAAFFLIPILLWIFIKPYFVVFKQLPDIKSQIQKFKYNAKLFHKAVTDQQHTDLLPEQDCIVLGNLEAKEVISIVTNPYCQPCAKAHSILDDWLQTKENLKIQVIFVTPANEQDRRTVFAKHMLALSCKCDPEFNRAALHDWYEKSSKNYNNWAQKYPIGSIDQQSEVLEKNNAWCKKNEITATPTIFINGYRIPSPWQLEDIKYFIE